MNSEEIFNNIKNNTRTTVTKEFDPQEILKNIEADKTKDVDVNVTDQKSVPQYVDTDKPKFVQPERRSYFVAGNANNNEINTTAQRPNEIEYEADTIDDEKKKDNYFGLSKLATNKKDIVKNALKYVVQAPNLIQNAANTIGMFTGKSGEDVVLEGVRGFTGSTVDFASAMTRFFGQNYMYFKGMKDKLIDEAANIGSVLTGGEDFSDDIKQKYTDFYNRIDRQTQEFKDKTERFLQYTGIGKTDKDGFIYDLVGGAASLLYAIGATVVTKSPAAAAEIFGAYQYQSLYEEGIEKGFSPLKARTIGVAGGAAEGALELVGLHVLIETLAARKSFAKILKSAATEFIQEASQQGAEEILATTSGMREESLGEILANVGYAGLIGALIGGGSATISNTRFVQKMISDSATKELINIGVKDEYAKQMVNNMLNFSVSPQVADEINNMLKDEQSPVTYKNADPRETYKEFGDTVKKALDPAQKRGVELEFIDEKKKFTDTVANALINSGRFTQEEAYKQAEAQANLADGLARIGFEQDNIRPSEYYKRFKVDVTSGNIETDERNVDEDNPFVDVSFDPVDFDPQARAEYEAAMDAEQDYMDSMQQENKTTLKQEARILGEMGIGAIRKPTADGYGKERWAEYKDLSPRIKRYFFSDNETAMKWDEAEDLLGKDLFEYLTGVDRRAATLNQPEIFNRVLAKEKEDIKQKAVADGTFLKAPNGKDSNLPEQLWLTVRTKAFKNWFGDWLNDPQNASKVVDENGEPLVVYHGTANDFRVFDKNKSYQGLFWFSNDYNKVNAGYDGAAGKGIVMPVFLNIKNAADWDLYDKYSPEELENMKYDGLLLKDGNETVAVAFDNKQIKSINNRGSFDRRNPDIYYQAAYHGTPHRFDTFSTEKIGTGEGAQAHGWGLYFARNKDVSEEYRRNLTNNDGTIYIDGKEIEDKEFGENIFARRETIKGKTTKEKLLNYKDKLIERIDWNSKNIEHLKKQIPLFENLVKELRKNKTADKTEIEDILEKNSDGIKADVIAAWQDLLDAAADPYEQMNTEEGYDNELNSENVASYFEGEIFDKQSQIKQSEKDINNFKKQLKTLESIDLDKAELKGYGQLFKVDIPEDDELLIERVKFKDQPKKVQKALLKILPAIKFGYEDFSKFLDYKNIDFKNIFETEYKDEAYEEYLKNPEKYNAIIYEDRDGAEIYYRLAEKYGNEKEASLKLNDVGVKGISYYGGLDGPAYVIFDDKAVKVLEKFYQQRNKDNNLIMATAVKSDRLNDILKTNTLIAPSFSITQKGQKELQKGNFGELLFIRKPETINYKKDNIYNGDIYSPRLPSPVYKLNGVYYDSAYEKNIDNPNERVGDNPNAEKYLFLGFDERTGKRIYKKYTAKNVLAELKKERLLRGERFFDETFSSFIAGLRANITSKDLLKEEAAKKLNDRKAAQEQYDKLEQEFDDLRNELQEYYKYEDFAADYIDLLLAIANNDTDTANEIVDFDNVPKKLINKAKDLIKKAQELPVSYFEAKPMREIGLNQFKKVLAPKGVLKDNQKEQLTQQGIEIVEYEQGKLDEAIADLEKDNSVYFQDNEQEQPRGSTTVFDRQYFINLFSTADKSTLMHEMAHAWLSEINYFASAKNATAKVLDIKKQLDNWLGVPDNNGRYSTEQQEQFAQNFEVYLKEGKAPTAKLKTVFARFKTWLSEIYDRIKDDLPKINDDVRELFDTILSRSYDVPDSNIYAGKESAIKEVIKNIQEGRASEVDGITIDDVYNLLNMAYTRKPRKPSKNLKQLLNDKNIYDFNELTKAGADTVLQILKDGGYVKEDATAEQALELARQALDGNPIYKLADQWRVAGDIDFARNLRVLEKVIEFSQIDSVMEKILTLQEEGYRNVEQGDVEQVKDEYKRLMSADVKEAKKIVEDIINRLHKKRFIDRAAQKQMIADLNLSSTVEEIKESVLNVIEDLQDEIKLVKEQLRNPRKPVVRKDKTIPPGKNATEEEKNNYKKYMRKQINKLLKQALPRKQNQQKFSKFDVQTQRFFTDLEKYNKMTIEAAQEELYNRATSIIDDEGVGLDNFEKMKNMFLSYKANKINQNSVEFYKQLYDNLQEINVFGRNAKDIENTLKKEQIQQDINSLVVNIEDNKSKNKLATGVKKQYIKWLGNWWSTINAVAGKKQADKDSLEKIEINIFNKNYETTENLKTKCADALGLKNVTDLDMTVNRYLNEEYTYEENDPRSNTSNAVKLNKMQLICCYIWMKNSTLRERIVRAFGNIQIMDMMDKLTIQDKKFGDELQQSVADMYDEVNTVYLKMYGLDMPQAENYFPSSVERIQGNMDLLKDNIGQVSSPGFIKARVQSNLPLMNFGNPVKIALDHIAKVNHFIYMQEKLADLNKVYKTTVVKRHITNAYGDRVYAYILQVLDNAKFTTVARTIDGISDIGDYLVNNYVLTKIAVKPSIMMKQLLSCINYAEDMSAVKWFEGFLKGVASPKKVIDFMMKNSKYCQSRFAKGGQSEALLKAMEGSNATFAKVKTFKGMLSWMTRVGDIGAIMFGGYPYVMDQMSKGVPLKTAIENFERATIRSQQASLPSTLSNFQYRGMNSWLYRAMFAFANTPNQYSRKIGDTMYMYFHGDINKKQFAKNLILYGVLNSFLYTSFTSLAILAGLVSGDWDDLKDDAIMSLFQTSNILALPIISQAYNSFVSKVVTGDFLPDKEIPLLDDMVKIMRTATKDELEFKDWLTIVDEVASLVLGVPVKTLYNTFVGSTKDLLDGEYGKFAVKLYGATESRANKIFDN